MSDTAITCADYGKALNEHKLVGSRCRSTGQVFVPAREICPTGDCKMEMIELSGQGKLAAFTIVYIGTAAMIAAGFDRKNPYCVGIVELAEGGKVSGQILGVDVLHPETIKVGMPLRSDFVERGEGETKKTFLVFEPA